MSRASSSSSPPPGPPKAAPQPPRPSSSVILLSPRNQVLLLHRVKSSTSFASAHVFPGGNLDPFHDGRVPDADAPDRHLDGPAYRMGAIRECFEETGILLARRTDGSGELVSLDAGARDAARKRIHGSQVTFGEWVSSVGGVPDTENLVPFTRWITPTNVPKRFTTQMYVYALPVAQSSNALPSEMLVPTPDGGVEHTAATFAPAQTFLARAAAREIILFPPQVYLLHHLARFFQETDDNGPLHYTAQRERLFDFLRRVPTSDAPRGREHPTASISWADKVMSPHNLFIRSSDKRIVLGLDKPGPELKGTDRGGDWDRVAFVKFTKAGPIDVEIRDREEALAEEKRAKSETKL